MPVTPEIRAVLEWHFQILGKEINQSDLELMFQVLVRDNPNFPTNEYVEVILKDFFSAIHYGSTELKGVNIKSHATALSEWLKNRRSMSLPAANNQTIQGKPDNWRYDPDLPLPKEITRQKAKELLETIAKIYSGDMDRVFNNQNFMHYVNKLKARYYE